MKKLIMTAAVVACASIVTAQVVSDNIVGYTKVSATGGELTLVGINFDTGGATITDLIGTSVPALSVVYKWDKVTDTYAVSTINSRGAWSQNFVLDRGDALFVKPSGAGTSDLVFAGEVLSDPAVITVPTGIRAMSYEFPVDAAWTSTQLSSDVPALSALYTWNQGTQSYGVSTKNSRGAWSVNPTISPSQAFFINNPGGQIDVTEPVPFTP